MMTRQTLHIVDPSSRNRAELARAAFGLGLHAEVYATLSELTERPPREGIILLRDRHGPGGMAEDQERLVAAEVWLPVLAMDENPDTKSVVAAVKAGVLDYLALPLDDRRLAGALGRISHEAIAHSDAKRRMIEARGRISRLSRREREVLDWLSLGSSNKAIARELEISPRTVEIHRANMMTKLGASHPADAVRLQLEAGLGQGAGTARAQAS